MHLRTPLIGDEVTDWREPAQRRAGKITDSTRGIGTELRVKIKWRDRGAPTEWVRAAYLVASAEPGHFTIENRR